MVRRHAQFAPERRVRMAQLVDGTGSITGCGSPQHPQRLVGSGRRYDRGIGAVAFGVVRGAHQRAGLDVEEPQGQALLAEPIELRRRHEPFADRPGV